jgi:dTDP-4-amino-4,6-dideoxygalactose transaminase
MFYMLLADQALRDRLLQHLNAAGINAVFHYVPLHSSPMGRRLGYAPSDLPITESVSRRLVRLPCFFSLTDEQQSVVIGEVRRFFCRA